MKSVLILESKYHHARANIIDEKLHFPNCKLTYGGLFFYKNKPDFFTQFDLVVSTVSTSNTADHIISKCRKKGVPTLLLCEGIIEWENLYSNRFVIKRGTNLYDNIYHEYFGVMGKLESKYFSIHSDVTAIHFTPARALKMNIAITSNKNMFLLTTANRPYFNEGEKARCTKLMLSIQRSLIDSGIQYKVRIFDSYLLGELAKVDETLLNDVDSSFDECLHEVSALITTPSTIVFNAMQENIPVCQLQYRNSPTFVQTGWVANESVDLNETLLSMISPKKERMDFQKTVLSEHYSESTVISEISKNNVQLSDKKVVHHVDLKGPLVINLEPIARLLDDVMKIYGPKFILAKWKKIISKYR
ncbi:hypothetical protein AB4514_03285 [Vibrio cyclitrophicus]